MMLNMLPFFPPSFLLILGGLAIFFLPRVLVKAVVLLLPLVVLFQVWHIPQAADTDLGVLTLAGFRLYILHIHPYTHIFATVFTIAAFAGGLFSLNQGNPKETAAAFVYAGSAVGVTFAGDFATMFIYWEIMAIASVIVLLFGGTERANKAAIRYGAMHFLGGVLLMAGILAQQLLYQNDLSIVPLTVNAETFDALLQGSVVGIAPWCIFLGVLVNAAAPPFSAWLPDSYPEASPFGSVYLSAFTTKTAVFVLITMFAGNGILVYIGLFMAVYGIIYAMLENDMRRILAYSIINQVGFMITGAGIGTTMALNGAATHAFCHIIYKALLMMSAGSVLYMTGKRKCTELGGLYHTMKWTMWSGIVGAMSISAFPWTSGFVSKSMISDAAATQHLPWVWGILTMASAGVFLHAGIKFPWFVFFNRESGLRPKEAPWNMRLAMGLLVILCLVPGLFPNWLYAMLPEDPGYVPYTGAHVVTQLQLLLFSGLAFFLMLPMLKRTDTISLDFDWGYRVFILNILLLLDKLAETLRRVLFYPVWVLVVYIVNSVSHVHGPEGVMARNWSIGTTVLWILLMLGASLFIYYSFF